MFYVYGDYTDDGRPFYFGKGNEIRVLYRHGRNKRHDAIMKAHGSHRRVLIITSSEDIAFLYERWFILRHRTNHCRASEGHWSANFTDGGEGRAGYKATAESRERMSLAKRGKRYVGTRVAWNKGKKTGAQSPEHIAKRILAWKISNGVG